MRSNNSRGSSVMSTICAGVRKRRPTLLRESCGRAASAERGSALLLVIGALALISVFAAVYVTIGQGDGRSSSAHELNRHVEEFGSTWGDYIAQQIADDRLDTVLRLEVKADDSGGPVGGTFGGPGGGGQNPSANFQQVIARENTDRASTDWSFRSIPLRMDPSFANNQSGNAAYMAFNPTGTHSGLWRPLESDPATQLRTLRTDPRVASDPWLASTEATYLGGGGDRFSSDRPFAEKHRISYLDKRDWAHISNISPDGLFVNLYNLRGDAGGYEAEPGYTPGGYDHTSPPSDPPKMSDGLSLLWKRTSGSDQGALQAMDVRQASGGAPGGFWVPGYDTPVAWTSVFANEDPENVPALWSTNQRFMLMPLDQTFFSYDRDGNIADWESPDYPAYQYADADGDGLADSRWIELTDSSESTAADSVFSFLAPTDGYRLFAAVRVVDLSALVNLNVATDAMVGPSDMTGWTPSSIDLRRIFTMHDQGRELRDWNVPTAKGLALGGIERDARPGQGDVYNDYSKYQFNPASLALGAAPSAGVDSNGLLIGRFASDAVALAIESESSLGESDRGRLTAPAGTLRDESRFVFDAANPEDNAALRQYFFNRRAAVDPTDRVSLGGSDQGAGHFSMTDLSELMTFWGVNDDEVNSRLEQVVFGRYDDRLNNLLQTTARLSPMLSTRPTSLDRKRHDTLNSQGNPSRPPESDGIVDADSMALRALSPRMRLTTFSGGADILSMALGDADLATLGDFEAPLQISEFLRGLDSGDTSESDVFELFAMTLAASAELEDAWDASKPEYDTMFYGHQGPELALTLSAFMTANLIDAYDEDNEPTPISVLVAGQGSGTIGTDFDKNNQAGGAFPWPQSQKIKLGDIGEDGMSVPQGDEGSVNRLAYTVYGVEAYPVLTEVSSMVIMTDASKNAGGDDEAAGGGGFPWDPVGGGNNAPQNITIETDDWDATDAWNNNPDLALVLIAFQLTNPFDETISLGSDTKGDGAVLDDDEYLFYLEYNGRTFKVGDFDENANEYTNVTLAPGESRNFYVVANDGPDALGDIATKWQDLRQGYDPGATVSEMDVEMWLDRQLEIGTGGAGPARMREFDAATGMAETFQGYENILKPAPTPALGRAAEERKVRLWRRMELQTAGAFVGATKTPEHDLLVDRISDPTSGGAAGGGGVGGGPVAWDDGAPRLLPVPGNISSDDVGGTLAGTEASANGNVAGTNDNSGFTMVFTGTIRRGDHPTMNPVQPAGEGGRGVLPGWMIESSSQTIASDRSVPPRGNGSKLRNADFDMTKDFAFESFRDFLDDNATTAPGPAVPTIAKHPRAKRGVGGASKAIDRTVDGDPFYAPATGADEVVINPELGPDGRDVVAMVTDPYTGTSREIPLVRATDLLLIPAVGWIEAPDPANPLNFDDDQWITYGEALGYALGMTPEPGGAVAPDRDPLQFLVDRTGTGHRYVLDRLHLRLDDYVSYYDEDTDGVYRANAGSLDTPIGSGLPLAMDLVSRFRRFGPEDAGESLTSKVMGRINLNTATLDTLRTVPLLSPTVETLTSGRREFWGFDPRSPGTLTNAMGPALDSEQSTPDIAAQLLSYRDRAPAEYRASSFDYTGVDISVAGNVPFSYLGLDESGGAWVNQVMAASVMVTNGGTSMLGNPTAASELGRTIITGIEGLREQAGFTAPAEIMAAIADETAVNSLFGAARYDQIRQNLPVTYGSDVDFAGDPVSIESRRVTPATGTAVTMTTDRLLYNNESDEIANDYEEQLAVLDAVLSTTDVRSDTFAVWFVVHGYQESDVADLRPDDPLVPSFARRFIMVVDRSNVTQRGQRPRILMMREVPL